MNALLINTTKPDYHSSAYPVRQMKKLESGLPKAPELQTDSD